VREKGRSEGEGRVEEVEGSEVEDRTVFDSSLRQ